MFFNLKAVQRYEFLGRCAKVFFSVVFYKLVVSFEQFLCKVVGFYMFEALKKYVDFR
jgi:hypothetical protein